MKKENNIDEHDTYNSNSLQHRWTWLFFPSHVLFFAASSSIHSTPLRLVAHSWQQQIKKNDLCPWKSTNRIPIFSPHWNGNDIMNLFSFSVFVSFCYRMIFAGLICVEEIIQPMYAIVVQQVIVEIQSMNSRALIDCVWCNAMMAVPSSHTHIPLKLKSMFAEYFAFCTIFLLLLLLQSTNKLYIVSISLCFLSTFSTTSQHTTQQTVTNRQDKQTQSHERKWTKYVYYWIHTFPLFHICCLALSLSLSVSELTRSRYVNYKILLACSTLYSISDCTPTTWKRTETCTYSCSFSIKSKAWHPHSQPTSHRRILTWKTVFFSSTSLTLTTSTLSIDQSACYFFQKKSLLIVSTTTNLNICTKSHAALLTNRKCCKLPNLFHFYSCCKSFLFSSFRHSSLHHQFIRSI